MRSSPAARNTEVAPVQAMRMLSSRPPMPLRPEELARRKRVRLTTLVVTGVVLFFYFGFIAMMLYRATR
jgi:hypothetical protein